MRRKGVRRANNRRQVYKTRKRNKTARKNNNNNIKVGSWAATKAENNQSKEIFINYPKEKFKKDRSKK